MLTYHMWFDIILATSVALLLQQYWSVWRNSLQTRSHSQCRLSACHNEAVNMEKQHKRKLQIESSVWCYGSHHTNRMCYFHNLCYLPDVDEFVFLHGNLSVYVGIPDNRYDPALLDMSSVRDHSTQYFNFMDADADKMASVLDSAVIIEQTSLLFRRFHADNLMHVLHDDLLPLFHTISTLPFACNTGCDGFLPLDLQLVYMEGWDPGPFEGLYSLFSSAKPLYKVNMTSVKHPTCFRDAYVGISKYTTWYQYGFVEPQGPLDDIRVTANDIRHFCDFLRVRLNVTVLPVQDERIIVLVSRRYNRLILNEIDLTFALAQNFNQKVVTIALETHTLRDMISVVSKASILVGMHGSMLALAMFLPRGSTIVELFPYAVNPLHYTPYRTLTGLKGMDVKYLAWQNTDVTKTITYPERSWEEGGIIHLPEDEQRQIMSSHEVPLHLCCRNAEWLYRIYQDTIVDVASIISLLKTNNLQQVQSRVSGTVDQLSCSSENRINVKRLCPSHVRNIICSGDHIHGLPALQLSWRPPANILFLSFVEIKYEVWIQEEGEEDYTAWILTQYQYTFTAGIDPNTRYNVWIRCILDETVGPFNSNHVLCST